MEWPTWSQIKDIAGFLGWILGAGILYKLARWLQKVIVYRARGIPRKTFIVLSPKRAMWCKASIGDEAAMQVMADIPITNFTHRVVCLDTARLNKKTATQEAMPLYIRPNDQMQYEIPAGKTVEVRTVFFIKPRKKLEKPFKAKVCFIDQFNNEHWSKKISFEYR